MFRIILLSFFQMVVICNHTFAQHDTTYYEKYPDRLGIGIFQAIRNNSLRLSKVNPINTTQPNLIDYNTNGKGLTGFVFNYDKIYFALGFKTESKEIFKKGRSANKNFALQLRGNKLVIEINYRKYKGFYDLNSPLYIPDFTDSTPYYRNESLENKTFKIKTFYFLNNKKFSYNSAYFGGFRQLKSAFSWVLNGNLYFSNIKSDSLLIPYYAKTIFEDYATLKGIKVTGFSFGGGASVNLVVFKRFFINTTLTLGIEPQWRRYYFTNKGSLSPFKVSLASDLRAALGFNAKKFFALFSLINDLTINNNKEINITGNFLTTAFSIGYRFYFENKATKWLKENKIYKMI